MFNYGHTFGHAIESVTGYRISHGQAVSRGMDMANYLFWQLKYIDEAMFLYLRGILSPNLPEFVLSKKQQGPYVQALSKDKKNAGTESGMYSNPRPRRNVSSAIALGSNIAKFDCGLFLTS